MAYLLKAARAPAWHSVPEVHEAEPGPSGGTGVPCAADLLEGNAALSRDTGVPEGSNELPRGLRQRRISYGLPSSGTRSIAAGSGAQRTRARGRSPAGRFR